MGLGPVSAVSLADAREAARAAARIKAAGHDPIQHRNQLGRDQRLAVERAKTFKQVAEEYIETKQGGWRSLKSAAQWKSSLKAYAYPVFGDIAVADVSAADIKKALGPIWTTKTETASRVRGRIEEVLRYAGALDLRTGDNPARYDGHLSVLLPAASRLRPVKHHPSLPYREVRGFLDKLRKQDGSAAKALEFTILTAARTSETVGARWDEIDLDQALWTIPARRMKAGREHRVPLSRSAVALLRELEVHRGANEYVFRRPGSKKPLSNMAMLAVIKRMKLKGKVTTHGFRSSFRNWAGDNSVDASVAEAAQSGHVWSTSTRDR